MGEYIRGLSPDRFLFLNGTHVPRETINQTIIFEHEMNKDKISHYDCIPNNSDSPLVNQRVIDLLFKYAPNDVEFFDTEIHCKDGILTHYKLLNVTSKVKGIDHELSVYKILPDTDVMYGIERLVYKPGTMNQHVVARDEEFLMNILVTEDIKQAFEKEKIKGAFFILPEDY